MLHLETVSPTLLRIIQAVSEEPFFENFRLVGGTALSLHLGHIAALKLEAVINRKEEKDFRDIHALLKFFSMADLLKFFHERYSNFSTRLVTDHLLAAPFVERDQSIELLSDTLWENICVEITQSVANYYEEGAKNREQLEQNRLKQRIEALKNKKD
jgi:hypothetical protein